MPLGRLSGAAVLAFALAGWLALPAAAHPEHGTLQSIHADDFRHGRSATAYGLEQGGRVRPVLLAAPTSSAAGDAVAIDGESHAGQLVGSAVSTRALARGETGPRKVLVVLINFASDPREPWTVETVRNRIFTASDSTNAFFREESWDQISLTGQERADGDVTGWHTIDADPSICQISTWGRAGEDAARAAGVSTTGYDHIMYVFPGQDSCWFAGAASVGGWWSWINGTLAPSVIAHELGHNMHLHHAGALACADGDGAPVALSASCTLEEYGDRFDVMGAYGARHSHGWHLGKLGVLSAQNVRPVTESGTYTLRSALSPTTEPTTLRIPRGGESQDAYELEIRSPGGVFEAVAPTDFSVNGVSLRLNPDPGQIAISQLLDGTPGSGNFFRDAALPPGAEFDDGTIRISVISAGEGTATVQVTIEEPADTDAPSVPAGLRGEVVDGAVRLDWDPSSDNTGVSGYVVMRDGAELGSTADTIFLDNTAAPGAHAYSVAAVDAAANRSSPSEPTVVSIPGEVTPPAGPTLKPPAAPPVSAPTASRPVRRDSAAPRVRLRRVGRVRKGRVRVRARATDDRALASLELWMRGRRLRRTRTGKLDHRLRLAPGRHTILAIARDAAGHRSIARLRVVAPRRRPIR